MRAFAPAVVVLSALLSGCSGGSAASEDSVADPQPLAEEGASIVGTVLDTEAQPIVGALVAVDEQEPVTTGADGRFVVRGLEPGDHVVVVQALGYTSLMRKVSVAEDEEAQATFVLERLAVEDPYVEVLQFKGYSICDYMVWIISGRLPPQCDNGQSKSLFRVNMLASWRFHVTEMKWRGGVGGYDSFRLFTGDDGDCTSGSPCYGLVYGRNYARVEGEPGKTDLVKYYDPWMDHRGPPYPDGNFTMVVNGQWIGMFQPELNNPPQVCQAVLQAATGAGYKRGCLGVGVSTGIPYELYVSVFHWMGPDDLGACCPATKYTAIPDQ